MKKISDRLSYSKRIFIVFALLCSVSIFLVAGTYYVRLYADNRKLAQNEFKDISTRTAQALEREIDMMDMISCQIFGNKKIQKELFDATENRKKGVNYFEQNPDARNNVQEALWSFNSPRKVVANLSIIYPDMFIGLLEIPSVEEVNRIWNQGLYENWDGYYKILPTHEDPFAISEKKDRITVSLLRKMNLSFYSQEDVWVIEVQQSYEKIEEICSQNYDRNNMQLYVVDEDGNIVYPYEDTKKTREMKRVTELFGSQQCDVIVSSKEISGIGMQHQLSNAPWKVLVFQRNKDFSGPIFRSVRWILIFGGGMLIFMILAVFFATKRIMNPIVTLRKTVENSDTGEALDFSDLKTEIDEIDLLQRAFTKMVKHIRESAELMGAMREKELELKIEVLQAQINPHFLYNSLAAISAAGMEDGSFRTQMMCVELSELLRYAGSDTGKHVDIQTELENLENYLKCMKWRYEDNLEYRIEVEGKTNVDFIPKLTFQPLAENSFAHGFSNTLPPYKIQVNCAVSENGWIFTLKDNGCGISDERLLEIQTAIDNVDFIFEESKAYTELRTENMAILNIYMRLKQEYGRKVCFTVKSKENGTEIKIEVTR